MRTPAAKTIEIRRRGDLPAFDLFIDGKIFPFAIARRQIEIEPLWPDLYILHLPLFAESVIGLEEFNAFILEEDDRHRVRSADIRDSDSEVD